MIELHVHAYTFHAAVIAGRFDRRASPVIHGASMYRDSEVSVHHSCQLDMYCNMVN